MLKDYCNDWSYKAGGNKRSTIPSEIAFSPGRIVNGVTLE